MAWNTPTDWSYKEAPGSEKLNEQIRDNLTYLKASVPAGVMFDYAGSTAPDQFLLCNGAAVSRSTYSALYTAIGTTFGSGDGSTTFNVPDCRGRVTVGAGTGTGLTARVLAAIFGTETHQLTEAEMPTHTHIQNAHTHTQDAHQHQLSTDGDSAGTYYSLNTTRRTLSGPTDRLGATTATNQNTTPTNQNTGGGGAHANTQPSIVVTKIIKY